MEWQLPENSLSPIFATARPAGPSFRMPSPQAAHYYDASAPASFLPDSGSGLYGSGGSGAGQHHLPSDDDDGSLRPLDVVAAPVGSARRPGSAHSSSGGAHAPQPAVNEPLRFVDDPVVGLPAASHPQQRPFAAAPAAWGSSGDSNGASTMLKLSDLGGRRDVLQGYTEDATCAVLRPANALGTMHSAFSSGSPQLGSGHASGPPSPPPPAMGGSGSFGHMLGAGPPPSPPPTSVAGSLFGLGLGLGGGMWGSPAVPASREGQGWAPALPPVPPRGDEAAWAALAAGGGGGGGRTTSSALGERTAKAALANLWG